MSNQTVQTGGENGIATTLKVIAWLTYIGGFISGFIVGAAGRYDFNLLSLLIAWVGSFISGTLFLGFAEVISLLQKLVDSGNRKFILQGTTELQKKPEQFSDLPKL